MYESNLFSGYNVICITGVSSSNPRVGLVAPQCTGTAESDLYSEPKERRGFIFIFIVVNAIELFKVGST
jgi:hypothetical protein